MSVTVKTVAGYLEELAPLDLALESDPVGLQVGSLHAPVRKILVALEMNRRVLTKARTWKADLVITHHPLLFHPLSAVDEDTPAGELVAAALRLGLNVYSAHTNLDAAPRGVSCLLADLVGLAAEGRRVIEKTGEDRLLKLAVFVPEGSEDAVRDALAAAGAGWIGRYSHCTFQAPGTGTFLPREGTDPYIGRPGRLEKVKELRLETILPASRREKVVEAMLAVHPYEEVAYDLYPLELPGRPYGLGLIGELEPAPQPLPSILDRCRRALKPAALRVWAPPEKKLFSRVAVCGGSGGRLVAAAARAGAELFIAGDFRHHDLQEAAALDLALVDAGHAETEAPVVPFLEAYLKERLADSGHGPVEVLALDTGYARWQGLTGGKPPADG